MIETFNYMNTLILTLILSNIFFAYFCIKFALIIINIQDKIENALDKIDIKYNRLGQILDIPVFYDSPEIKNVINEVYEVQDIVLSVANDLSKPIKNKRETDFD